MSDSLIITSDKTLGLLSTTGSITTINSAPGSPTILSAYLGAAITVSGSAVINYREYIASEAISGQQVVSLVANQFRRASNAVTLDANLVVGVTIGASSTGTLCRAYNNFLITDAGFGFVAGGNVFLLQNGALSQAPPTTGVFLLRIGVAISATELWVEIDSPVFF